MSVSSVVEEAYTNYTNYQQAVQERAATRSLLQLVGKPANKQEFAYGQSIYIIEQNIVTELQVYAYGQERIFARRLNGVRTSVSRESVIFMNEDAARGALARRKA